MVAVKEYAPYGVARRDSDGISLSPCVGNADIFEFGRSKFLEEAQVLAKLRQISRVVSVYDFIAENNTAYLIMDYLAGMTLRQLQKRQVDERFEYERALPIFISVLNSLSEIHHENVIHADVTPQNIFFCGNGSIKLIDFGSAKHATAYGPHSPIRQVTSGYTPCEQYGRDVALVGPWSDIYSAAASFYHLLTGVQPVESMLRLSNDTLKRPSECGVDLPVEAEAVLMKALSVNPQDRWASAADFADNLRTASVASGKKGLPLSGNIVTRSGRRKRKPLVPLAQLRNLVDAHNRFLQKKTNGKRLSARNKDFSCLKIGPVRLMEADLTGAVFACSDLSGADFSNADLSCADFTGANLRHTKFANADLRGACFDHADLTGSTLGWADCREAVMLVYEEVRQFSAARVNFDQGGTTSFRSGNLSHADMKGANLQAAQFTDAQLDNVDLSSANLKDASLVRTRLAHAKFDGAILLDCDFAGADLKGVDTTAANFETAKAVRQMGPMAPTLHQKFEAHRLWIETSSAAGQPLVLKDTDLSGLRLEGVNWSAAHFVSVDLTDANLTKATLSGASFTGCKLIRANMSGSAGRGVKFVSCNLSKADFCHSKLSPLNVTGRRKMISVFDGSILKEARLNDCACEQASFRNADLTKASFENAILIGGNFDGANLKDTIFKGAVTDEATGIPG